MDYLFNIYHLLYMSSGLLLVVYYLYFLWPLNLRSESRSSPHSLPAVSLIIAYKNEYKNLKFHLDHWLAQDYPDFEIILVNDHSTDESPEYLSFRDQAKLKLVSLDQTSGKKAAIEAGVNAANHSLLLFTDADCKPMSAEWMRKMVEPMIQGRSIVIGYSGFYPKLSLLNAIQRYENCMNAIQNSAMIQKGRAYMAVGRNLAYQRTILESEEWSVKQSVLSGDDDLLVNQLSKNGNTIFVEDTEAQTISKATGSWSSFFFQKRRQLQAGRYYKASDRMKLAALGISQLLFNVLFIKHLLELDFRSIILSIFVMKLILQLIVTYKPMKRLGEIDLWWQSPVLEIIYLPIISLIGISQYLYKVDRWK